MEARLQQFVRYIQQSGAELRKVTWPTRRNAIRMSIIVIIFSLIMAAGIGLVDFALTKALQTIILKG